MILTLMEALILGGLAFVIIKWILGRMKDRPAETEEEEQDYAEAENTPKQANTAEESARRSFALTKTPDEYAREIKQKIRDSDAKARDEIIRRDVSGLEMVFAYIGVPLWLVVMIVVLVNTDSFVAGALAGTAAGAAPYLLYRGIRNMLNEASTEAAETKKREYEEEREEYKRQFEEAVSANWSSYLGSEFVQQASDEIISFLCRECEQMSRASNVREIRLGLTVKLDESKLYLRINGVSKSKTVDFTGEGWRYEKLEDPRKRSTVLRAIAESVKARLNKQLPSGFPAMAADGYHVVSFDSGDDSSVTINYNAGNSRYVPTKRI